MLGVNHIVDAGMILRLYAQPYIISTYSPLKPFLWFLAKVSNLQQNI